MLKSRLVYTGKNVFWGYAGSIVTALMSFVLRTAFIHTIGIDYLGINGLFTSVLGVLTLTELGIGTAMNYSLYKPVSENDTEKIRVLMHLYKRAYRVVAAVVAGLGLIILPFLKYIIKGADGIEYVSIYYLVFLFNTVSSYFVSYKYSLVNADQKNYLVTNITAVSTVLMNVVQIAVLTVFKSYIFYLVTQTVFQLAQKIYTSYYIDRRYPYLKDKSACAPDRSETEKIKKNVKGLILHKVGEISVYQTDNIIISAFINIATVGLVSNYTLIINAVNSFVNVAFSSTTGSLGNLFATDDNEKHHEIFNVLDFIGFWIFGFTSVAIFALAQPFITLIWGGKYVLPIAVVSLIMLNNYLVGQRISVNNIKVAGGIFTQDKYLSIMQGIVNLAVSVVLAKRFGILGVYIGTIVSGLIPSLLRPYIVFKNLLGVSAASYYKRFFVRLLLICVTAVLCLYINLALLSHMTWPRFFTAAFITAIIPNIIIFVLYRKTKEFAYLKNILTKLKGRLVQYGG